MYTIRDFTGGPASPGSPFGPLWLLSFPAMPYSTKIFIFVTNLFILLNNLLIVNYEPQEVP